MLYRQGIRHTACATWVWAEKEKAQVVSCPVIEEASEEVAVEELTGKEVTPEEVTVKVTAPEDMPVVNAPLCLEELIWAILQEVRKMHESAARHEHFEFSIWEELQKLATLKGREVALAQGNVAPAGATQESAMCYEAPVLLPDGLKFGVRNSGFGVQSSYGTSPR